MRPRNDFESYYLILFFLISQNHKHRDEDDANKEKMVELLIIVRFTFDNFLLCFFSYLFFVFRHLLTWHRFFQARRMFLSQERRIS